MKNSDTKPLEIEPLWRCYLKISVAGIAVVASLILLSVLCTNAFTSTTSEKSTLLTSQFQHNGHSYIHFFGHTEDVCSINAVVHDPDCEKCGLSKTKVNQNPSSHKQKNHDYIFFPTTSKGKGN